MPARRSIKSPDDDIPRRGSSHVDIDAVIGADDGLIGTLDPSDVDAFLPWAAGMDDADGVMLESNRQGCPATLNHDFFVCVNLIQVNGVPVFPVFPHDFHLFPFEKHGRA